KLDALEQDILAELDAAAYTDVHDPFRRLETFQEFVRAEAKKYGIPVVESPRPGILSSNQRWVYRLSNRLYDIEKTLKSGEREDLLVYCLAALAGIKVNMLLHFENPYATYTVDKRGRLTEISFRSQWTALPTVVVPYLLLALRLYLEHASLFI